MVEANQAKEAYKAAGAAQFGPAPETEEERETAAAEEEGKDSALLDNIKRKGQNSVSLFHLFGRHDLSLATISF